MKRLHVHVAIDNLDTSIGLYAALFGASPDIVKSDYAKWMLEEGRNPGRVARGLRPPAEGRPAILDEGATTCCYAKSEKSWIADPQGISWETFLTSGESTVYGDSADLGSIRTTKDAGASPAPDRDSKTVCGGAS